MAEAGHTSSEAELLFSLVTQRYGTRLAPAALEEVRRSVEGIVRSAEALRPVHLANSDEPSPVFVPYRQEG